jgi:hypothetical protein
MTETEKKSASNLATVTLDCDHATLKKMAEKGQLAKFVETFPVLMAGQMKAQLVEMLAAGGYKVSMKGSFTYDGDDYGNGFPPIGPRPRPHWAELGMTSQLQIAAKQAAGR